MDPLVFYACQKQKLRWSNCHLVFFGLFIHSKARYIWVRHVYIGKKISTSLLLLFNFSHLLFVLYIVSCVSELAMWGECDNRRPSIYHCGCHLPIPASQGEVWVQWEEARCFVHRKIHLELVFRKFARTILIFTPCVMF